MKDSLGWGTRRLPTVMATLPHSCPPCPEEGPECTFLDLARENPAPSVLWPYRGWQAACDTVALILSLGWGPINKQLDRQGGRQRDRERDGWEDMGPV